MYVSPFRAKAGWQIDQSQSIYMRNACSLILSRRLSCSAFAQGYGATSEVGRWKCTAPVEKLRRGQGSKILTTNRHEWAFIVSKRLSFCTSGSVSRRLGFGENRVSE